MTETQKRQIANLRADGASYGKISEELGIAVSTIKTYCTRHGLGGVAAVSLKGNEVEHFCKCCGEPLLQVFGRKEKRFCSDKCRNKWWNTHLDIVNRRANYDFVCAFCKKEFISYGNKKRKYCNHKCYIADRFGGN